MRDIEIQEIRYLKISWEAGRVGKWVSYISVSVVLSLQPYQGPGDLISDKSSYKALQSRKLPAQMVHTSIDSDSA